MYVYHQVQKPTKLTSHNFSLYSKTISLANFNNLIIISIMIIMSTNSLGKDSGKYCYNCKHIYKNILHSGMERLFCFFYIKQQLCSLPRTTTL